MELTNPIPQGKYIPASRYGKFIFTAGMTPRKDGQLILTGKVSPDQPIEFYRTAVCQAAENALAAAYSCLNTEERIERILQVTVYVNSSPDYQFHSKIADLASEYFCDKLADCGIAARTAIGVSSLPGNAPLELQITCIASQK